MTTVEGDKTGRNRAAGGRQIKLRQASDGHDGAVFWGLIRHADGLPARWSASALGGF